MISGAEASPPSIGPGASRPPAARLLGLRLQGFKSFAERTNVEFGGGISAVVGPNGSGKSNLADALRWALGEQGRALRSRKAEDVIWAGSEKRAAQGMADVTLVIDNADGLLPVDFGVVELGRRLFRSGENDYLLNKQRIRLRDLVDLLDGAHLADNAFLFIGQGMVDQALALRPDERRPLFEEVAGVRRHERRRRKAEEQLVESSLNLARVEDILAELRPQARRLAAQAEQQADRATVGDELAGALILATHTRWHEAASRLAEAGARGDQARAEADRAMDDLRSAELAASGLAAQLAARAERERELREVLDAARPALASLRLRETRLSSELEAAERDRRRLEGERLAAEAEIAQARRALAAPGPGRDLDLETALAEADRELAGALAELSLLRNADRARDQELAAVRRADAARLAEAETARRRLTEAERRLAEQRAATEGAVGRGAESGRRHAQAGQALARAGLLEANAVAELEQARAELETAEAGRAASADRAAAASSSAATLRGRLEALSERLDQEEGRSIARAARRAGGRRVDEDLVVEPSLRAAVEAALADRTRAYLVSGEAVASLASERGQLVIRERIANDLDDDEEAARGLLASVASAGGGHLRDAVRSDPGGAAGRLLTRAVWLPDLGSCLAIQSQLTAGWIAVPRDGSAVVDDCAINLGVPESTLERRAEHQRLTSELAAVDGELAGWRSAADTATEVAAACRSRAGAARAREVEAAADRRRAEDIERTSARDAEAMAREAAWHDAQLARSEIEVERLREALPGPETVPGDRPVEAGRSGAAADETSAALAAWQTRAGKLREQRDRLAERLAMHEATRRAAEADQARAEGAVQLAQQRIARAEHESSGLTEGAVAADAERSGLRTEIARAAAAEAQADEAVRALVAADGPDRIRRSEAERAEASARQRLREADDRLRAAERSELETRLGLDGLRAGVLVELAGLGQRGLTSLLAVVDPASVSVSQAAPSPAEGVQDTLAGALPPDSGEAADEVPAFEAALDAAASQWTTTAPVELPPSAARLVQLRRRYHELGGANPFAVAEYAELKVRLETIEDQHADLRAAMTRTHELIAELEAMIADQFRTTFAALETAFERRFEQLFGGGFARLSLTDPADLGATGIEIVARPPGKKAQALAMLSGGERALTAVALLFSMLEVRPVPFCVLDEVDAALDEANIGRFAEALRSLADRTQFIVITHNRGTIEAADALYGITVGADSVSRVISLRLDEAQALASDRRSEPALAG